MDNVLGRGRIIPLAIGQSYHLRRGKDNIIYAGMPNEDVYSIVQKKASGYQGFSWNLFFPKNKRDITIDGVDIHVERVTAEEIELRP